MAADRRHMVKAQLMGRHED